MFIAHVAIALLLVYVRISVSAIRVVELLPREVGRIAIDEDAGQYLAFNNDGTLVGTFPLGEEGSAPQPMRRAAGACVALRLDEVESLRGWPAIVDHANNVWGDRSRNIVINPKEYPGYAANLCVTDEVVGLKIKGRLTRSSDDASSRRVGEPTCQTQVTTTNGVLVGTSGSVAIGVDQGFTAESLFTVTKAASVGVAETVSFKTGVSAIADVTGSFTMSSEVTNTNAYSFGSTFSDVTKVTVTMQAPEGKRCHAATNSKTCQLQAEGKLRYTAEGWVWFNYKKKVDGHYKWAVNFATAIPNVNDRSSFLEFRGSIQANTKVSFAGKCV
ncbi:hypothetical protein WG66_000062 [Moniliophthora roreri]|uniref:Uncharacterized protein n=1 Tax=Moniliophthora roreri TaxID=221103 RepID=A0A0W0FTT9_MONRR|nr:hypothetical protein WG66_000062 [Moniliophthora roreri]